MKRRIGILAAQALLAILLVSVMIVPVVNADENQIISTTGCPESPEYAITPEYICNDIQIADPLEDTELLSIVFAESWLTKNNEGKDPQFIKLTIETSTLNNVQGNNIEQNKFYSPSEIDKSEGVALLRIPKKMVTLFNDNPNELIIDYPVDILTFYSSIDEMYNDLKEKQEYSDSIQRKENADQKVEPELATSRQSTQSSTFYGEWAQYYRKSNYDNSIVYVTGKIKPYSTVNEGQEAVIYQEREIYTNRDGDTIELTLFYRDDGDIFLSVPIYDEHQLTWETTSTWIDATAKPNYDYYVSISGGTYEVWFEDKSTGQWYYYSYDDSDNPATAVDWLMGSSELYLYGGIQHHFEAVTSPIIDEWTRESDGTWHKPRETFDFIRYSDNKPYVSASTWFSSDDIYSYHRCADTQN